MPMYQIDKLTGLPGKASFDAVVFDAFDESEDGPVSLAFVDIDFFKLINDTLGHETGDAVLVTVANLLKEIPGAKVVRYGGDEFVVVFPRMEREQAFLRLEKARQDVASIERLEILGKKQAVRLSMSVGIAAYPIDGANEAELMRKADGALYRAKLGGRNKVMLSFEERLVPKTTHFTVTQLERLAELAKERGVVEAALLREALDDLLVKHIHGFRTDHRFGNP